ncbi:MAG: hypothetical protein K2O13_00650 [Lachnospiraceae bacterium]|nr:hypothetical protein [Lachnospiraceae bacterium]
MTIKRFSDVPAFLSQVKACRGDVFFKTDKGDSLNLKSVLFTYVFAVLMQNPELMQNGLVICEDEGDYELLQSYLSPSK